MPVYHIGDRPDRWGVKCGKLTENTLTVLFQLNPDTPADKVAELKTTASEMVGQIPGCIINALDWYHANNLGV